LLKTIIVGIDGQTGGSDALALATAVADERARILLVNVFPYEARPSRGSLAGYEEILRADSEALLKEAANGRTDVECKAVAGLAPARTLQQLAEDEHADLIVMGSSHHGPVGRLLAGDTARATLHGAPCPVAIAPHDYDQPRTSTLTVGVGIDGTPAAKVALTWADQLAGDLGGSLHLRACSFVSVFDSRIYTSGIETLEEDHRAALQHELDQQGAQVRVSHTAEVTLGHPHRQLTALSESVDLLVIGSRGWGPAKRVFAGSTGDYLSHHSHCPLLVVPRPQDDASDAPRTGSDEEGQFRP